jgi:hypothetical protein
MPSGEGFVGRRECDSGTDVPRIASEDPQVGAPTTLPANSMIFGGTVQDFIPTPRRNPVRTTNADPHIDPLPRGSVRPLRIDSYPNEANMPHHRASEREPVVLRRRNESRTKHRNASRDQFAGAARSASWRRPDRQPYLGRLNDWFHPATIRIVPQVRPWPRDHWDTGHHIWKGLRRRTRRRPYLQVHAGVQLKESLWGPL